MSARIGLMLMIRMQRVGRVHEPVFRLVLTDSKNGPKSGKFKEILGSYDARRAENAQVTGERVNYWVSKGAKLSDTAHNLLVKKGIIVANKRNVLPKGVILKAKAPTPTTEGVEVLTESVGKEAPISETTPESTEVVVEPQETSEQVPEVNKEKVE